MSDQKKSTADILSQIRGGGGAGKPAEPPKPAESASAGESSSLESAAPTSAAPASGGSPSAKPAGPAPAGTAGILASIRSGGAGTDSSEPKPAATAPSAPAGPAPTGTANILASIKGGGAPKPAAGPAPSGTAGILAAIKGGGTGAAPAAARPAAPAKTAAAPDPAAAPAGLSAAEMIKAARGRAEAQATGKDVPAKPALPLPSKPLAKPVPAKAEKEISRRSAFVTIVETVTAPLVIAWGSLVAATAVSGLAMARFMMPNVLVEPPTKFKIGAPGEYSPGTVSTKWKAQFGVWIVNDEIDGQQMIYALSTVCTHLGCTPNWLEGEQKFKCPCHGSGFYKTGINFEGPAPRPLERHGIRLAEDGMLEVDKSLKFQMELGQWESSSSYVPA